MHMYNVHAKWQLMYHIFHTNEMGTKKRRKHKKNQQSHFLQHLRRITRSNSPDYDSPTTALLALRTNRTRRNCSAPDTFL